MFNISSLSLGRISLYPKGNYKISILTIVKTSEIKIPPTGTINILINYSTIRSELSLILFCHRTISKFNFIYAYSLPFQIRQPNIFDSCIIKYKFKSGRYAAIILLFWPYLILSITLFSVDFICSYISLFFKKCWSLEWWLGYVG